MHPFIFDGRGALQPPQRRWRITWLIEDDGKAWPGYAADDCDKIIGNEFKRTMTWERQRQPARLGGEISATAPAHRGCRTLFPAL
jgi:hypothetical protein